jgi:hypothetical protein
MNIILKVYDVIRKVNNNFIIYFRPQNYLNLLSWRLLVCNQQQTHL